MTEKPERLEKLLLDGLNSGDPIVVDNAYWENFKQRLKQRAKTKPK